MKKNHILLLVFILGFAVYFILAMLDNAAKKPVPLMGIEKNRVQIMDMFNGVNLTVIRKSDEAGGGFFFVSPFGGVVAEGKEVESFLDEFAKVSVKANLGTKDNEALSEFGIGKNSPWVMVTSRGREDALILGVRDPVWPGNYVLKKDRGELVITDRYVENLFLRLPESFRKRNVFEEKQSDISAFSIARKDMSISFRKYGEGWYLKESDSAEIYPSDTARTDDFLSRMMALEVRDFKSRDGWFSPEGCGLTSPRCSLTVFFATGTVKVLDVGNVYDNDKVYVGLNGQVRGGVPAVFLDDLFRSATYFVMYDITSFSPSRVAAFTVKEDFEYKFEKKRGRWYRTGKKTRRTSNEIAGRVLLAASRLRAERFFFDQPLGEVRSEYVFYDRYGKEISRILIGDASEGYVKVKLKDRKDIFGISPWIADSMKL